MAELIAKTPCAGLLPRQIGSVTLTEVAPAAMWSVAVLRGQKTALNGRLKDAGLAMPAPGRTSGKGDVRAIWMAPGQALVQIPELPDLSGLAAVTDQSDAWAIVAIDGAAAEDVLARLVPVDLRRAHFKVGHTARTLLGHMTASVTRTAANRFEVMVMRSMAGTLVHDLERAATGVLARG